MNFKLKNRRGQTGGFLINFAIILVLIIMIVPILFNLVTSMLGALDTQATNVHNVTEAGDIQESFTNVFDGAIVLSFFILVIVLLISAFLIDVHPAFIIVYIVSAAVLFVVAPAFFEVIDAVWDDPEFVTQQADLPLLNFLRNNLGVFLGAVYALSGIVFFLKFRGGDT